MNEVLRACLEKSRSAPFPEFGKVVGDFALYDSLLAGAVSSLLAGANVDIGKVPAPDQETEATLSTLAKKPVLDQAEADFYSYAQLLAMLRGLLIEAIAARILMEPKQGGGETMV